MCTIRTTNDLCFVQFPRDSSQGRIGPDPRRPSPSHHSEGVLLTSVSLLSYTVLVTPLSHLLNPSCDNPRHPLSPLFVTRRSRDSTIQHPWTTGVVGTYGEESPHTGFDPVLLGTDPEVISVVLSFREDRPNRPRASPDAETKRRTNLFRVTVSLFCPGSVSPSFTSLCLFFSNGLVQTPVQVRVGRVRVQSGTEYI